MTNSISGTTATIGACALALSSTGPADGDLVAGRQLRDEGVDRPVRAAATIGRGLGVVDDAGAHA